MDQETIISLAKRHGLLTSNLEQTNHDEQALIHAIKRFAEDIQKKILENLKGECRLRGLDLDALLHIQGMPPQKNGTASYSGYEDDLEKVPDDKLPPLSKQRQERMDDLVHRWLSRCQDKLTLSCQVHLRYIVHALCLIESSPDPKAQTLAEANWKRLDMVMQDLAKGLTSQDGILSRRACATLQRFAQEVESTWCKFRAQGNLNAASKTNAHGHCVRICTSSP